MSGPFIPIILPCDTLRSFTVIYGLEALLYGGSGVRLYLTKANCAGGIQGAQGAIALESNLEMTFRRPY
jgi:hypothetical protein